LRGSGAAILKNDAGVRERWSGASAPGAKRDLAGRQASAGSARLSDFTDMADHGVSNAGAPLDHPLYHFAKEFEARRAL
jgi:hypothetical protein